MKRFSMRVFLLVVVCLAVLAVCRADELAAVTGLVTDPNGRSVPGVAVIITNLGTNVASRTVTNDQGIYWVPSLHPGIYRMTLDKDGFKSIVKSGVELHVQDVASINFELQIGSVNETVTVEAGGLVINTTDATVSTVVDRQFAENLPLNGRSFQTLIQLTPGVVVVPSNSGDAGQFSVNGQRAASNYWMVDGVSANIGVSSGNVAGNGFGGTLGSFTTQGGTNSLVSVDALQEFRIQTSTYAPEFGRTPGGQISIVTRSGTNQFHGTAFDFFRNDILDANDWFANYHQLRKPEERQNDFGGTFSGALVKNRTFFFFSYEGLRLRLPQVSQSTVPDLNARQTATSAVQPFFNAYPFDPNQPNLGNGIAQFNASFSNPSSLDAYSIRIDHKLFNRVTLFGRYNYSPSDSVQRAFAFEALSEVSRSRIVAQTATLGATWTISPTVVNDVRFNYSHANASRAEVLDNFGGAVPLASLPLPSPYTEENAAFLFGILGLSRGRLAPGIQAQNLQRQINLVDSLSLTKGTHAVKFGMDFRRLSPAVAPPLYIQADFFFLSGAETGKTFISVVQAQNAATVLFRNFSAFAQDTWRIAPRTTVTYGLRWDLDAAPSSLSGPSIPAVTGYNLNDFSQLAIAPAGTPPFKTSYGSVAPRIGLAYQLTRRQNRETVLRGGFGVFYDLVSSEVGQSVQGANVPFGALKTLPAGTFPLNATNSAPPVIPSTGTISQVYAFNPDLKAPYTLQWNVALEQALGRQQTISASYVASSGRRLLQTFGISNPPSNPIVKGLFLDNTASSSYNALQVQFQRRLSHGLQALASYSWAHSIDDGSAGSFQITSNRGLPGGGDENRSSSDFDIRHAFSAAITYDIPVRKTNKFTDAILRGWSIQNTILARSAPPVDLTAADFQRFDGGISADVRPDVIAGQPVYLYGSNCASVMQALKNLAPGQGCPGGKGFNPNAFMDPPSASVGPNCPSGGCPTRQGTIPRNFLRGFGATEWDFAVHRDFPIHESVKLQFRAEMFNVLNHPSFGQPLGTFFPPPKAQNGFGLSQQTLGKYLDGGGSGSNVNGGSFSPLYQIGGPRSIQLALKLVF